MKHSFWYLFDGLLPLSAFLFWMPLSPQLSAFPALLWLAGQLLAAPQQQRWLLWPCLSLGLLGARLWWFNTGPSPASFADAVLFFVSLLASSSVALHRWPRLFKGLLVGFIPLALLLGAKPWNPNPFIGVNQAAYLMGFMLIVSLFWAFQMSQKLWLRLIASLISALSFVMIWQTGSRAALVATAVSICIISASEIKTRYKTIKPMLWLAAGTAILYILRWQFFSPSASLPGFKSGSDVGRLLAAQCYAELPFSGNNRFLYGVGFDRLSEFCHLSFQDSPLHHSHNLYVQFWSATGLLGAFALILLLASLFLCWHRSQQMMPSFVRCVGQASLVYVLLQSAFDLSVLHWPVTIIFSGIFLGVPLAYSARST